LLVASSASITLPLTPVAQRSGKTISELCRPRKVSRNRRTELLRQHGAAIGAGRAVAVASVAKEPDAPQRLALAGAQATLDAWKQREVPPMDNDGILMADEVGSIKSDGTWLVVLSACDTGTGEARAGEGVLGLRRGFIQAGAQNLLMILRPVADEETARFMMEFYSAAHKSGNAPKALADVQRDWLINLRKERGLADAVRIAGPFIMSSQGPVE